MITPEMQKKIAVFKGHAQNFQGAYTGLAGKASQFAQFPALNAQYKALMSRAYSIKLSIVEIGRKIDDAINWIKGNLGLGELGGFILPIAVMVAGAAFMTKWLSDSYALNRKLSAAQRLQKQGVPPAKAANIVSQIANGNSFMGSASKIIVPLGLGALALWFLPRMLKR